MRKFFLFFTLFFSVAAFALDNEVEQTDSIVYTIAPDDAVLSMIDSLLNDKFYNCFRYCEGTEDTLQVNDFQELTDSILKDRMQVLNEATPFDLTYNRYTKAFINLYINKRKSLSSSVLGRAPLYYPMIEEVFDRFEIPLELKHLAIVESALNPSARSRVGAQGLWQFMYRTGKMYDLNVTSYIDDRMNPYKATVAAASYMKDLYKMYGDWNLVLAAYNSGPGNVNKAIRRSGGHKDYWKIRPFLPRETRGYVPAFIAVNYMMNHANDHKIYASNTLLYVDAVDTIETRNAFSFKQLADYLKMDEKEIKFYNPAYKLSYIPTLEEGSNTLCLPTDKIGLFLTNEKNIYADLRRKEISDSIAGKARQIIAQPELIVHRVRSGEFLGYIAEKHGVTVRQLMAWNNLRSSRLKIGDKLKVYTTGKSTTPRAVVKKGSVPKSVKSGNYQVHVVKSGDTLWDIAQLYNGTSVNDLKKLNSNLNFKRLKPGMKVKVKSLG
jgi:membrane-bound lytic murein transglycosylase D